MRSSFVSTLHPAGIPRSFCGRFAVVPASARTRELTRRNKPIGKSFAGWDQLDELSWMNKPLMRPILAGAAALLGA